MTASKHKLHLSLTPVREEAKRNTKFATQNPRKGTVICIGTISVLREAISTRILWKTISHNPIYLFIFVAAYDRIHKMWYFCFHHSIIASNNEQQCIEIAIRMKFWLLHKKCGKRNKNFVVKIHSKIRGNYPIEIPFCFIPIS